MIAEGPECVNKILLEEINTSLHPEGDLNNFLVPPHEEYYAELISRNEGIIPPDVQDKIRRTTFIIFGTGSTGGNIAVTLAEIGAENFVIADKDTLDLSNLNRQPGTYRELGKQKTDIVGYRIQEINPYAKIAKYTQQISPDDIQKILNNIPQNSIVFFEMDDRDSFIEAVASSQRKSIPLILIIDIGHAVHISYFNPNKKIFNGKLSILETESMYSIGIFEIPINFAIICDRDICCDSVMLNFPLNIFLLGLKYEIWTA